MTLEAPPPSRPVEVWGVPIDVPASWRDQTIFTFRAAVDPTVPGPPPTVSMIRLQSASLQEAIDDLKLPGDVESLSVLSVGQRPDLGVFEQVIRFADPHTDAAVQQAIRLFEVGGHVYAFSVMAPGADFADAYAVLAKVQRDFVAAAGKGRR